MLTSIPRRLAALLPEGRLLPEAVWRRRHTVIVRIATLQAAGLAALALLTGSSALSALTGAVALLLPLAFALPAEFSRKVRAAATTLSLLGGSILLVHLLDGVTEAHFSFFVVVGLVSLYQDWTPFGIALLLTIAHHGLLGTAHPHDVFGTAQAQEQPWIWAGIHGAFVLAASLANLAAWRLNEQQGLQDPLTGLANRTSLAEAAARLLERSRGPVSVVLLDVDDFKAVNDARGHTTGDQLLTAVAARLAGCVRPEDVVGRLGGDEFAVVVADGPRTARAVAARVLAAFSDPVTVAGRSHVVHVSIGVADTTTAAERTAGTLLRNADLAMYLAKAQGKHRVVVYADGMDEAARGKVELVEGLSVALDEGQLEVHYQPVVSLSGGEPVGYEVTGYEALLRWHHPERGMVSPAEFVPLAEDTGLIVPIGAWVLAEAARQAVAWSQEAGRPIRMAVNLSPRQLAEEDIVATVAGALEDTGLPAAQLTLEVTESVLVQDVDRVVDRLLALRALGVRVAIDDFGTGYSSLSYLRRLPADIIKIDRSFVTDLAQDGASRTLISSIIELARSLRLDVVAEGVEDAVQRSVLQSLQCSHAQGYLFARPLPAGQQRPGELDAAPLPAPRRPVEAALPA
ncbi:putative bifunctional diguanylate cyclase/phosphodiesterase [Geodermatophilus sp. SYSU D00815]